MDQREDNGNAMDEIEQVFRRHGIIGVVSFVRLANVTETSSRSCEYEVEGEATVIAAPEYNELCVVAALDNLRANQDKVTRLIAQCREEASRSVQVMASLN